MLNLKCFCLMHLIGFMGLLRYYAEAWYYLIQNLQRYFPFYNDDESKFAYTHPQIIHWNVGVNYLFQELGVLELLPLGDISLNALANSFSKLVIFIGKVLLWFLNKCFLSSIIRDIF